MVMLLILHQHEHFNQKQIQKAYSATKGGIVSLTRTLAVSLGPRIPK